MILNIFSQFEKQTEEVCRQSRKIYGQKAPDTYPLPAVVKAQRNQEICLQFFI